MEIRDKNIDGGRAFDWGRTSADYAKYRDIYPQIFYRKILGRGLCIAGQSVLDIGTGTGVLPRNLYRYGAKWTAVDLSPEQIAAARTLSEGMSIDYRVSATEELDFPENSFDVITACQCFWYFDPERTSPQLARMLKPGGRLLLLYMGWLPKEDKIADASEKLVLRYNPAWASAGDTIHPIPVPARYLKEFEPVYHEEYRLAVPFTRESWNGRMRACRGIGASLPKEEIAAWEEEHKRMLAASAPQRFDVLHYAALAELRVRK
ncbi:MAG TPA: methyltransferase domain-containing protein [Candidatus Pygmaiobacter gallistercoris]|nr:methyltransferase domain-containing protein [Candidatus Pygmaiobacter gallistercoris]